MNEFTLGKIQGNKDLITGKLTFTQTKEYKIGIIAYFVLYMAATFADNFGYDWFVVPGFILAIVAFVLAYIPFSNSKKAGKVILHNDDIELYPKKEDGDFPVSPIDLDKISELEINIVQSIRWFSSFVILQFVVKQGKSESNFGLTIKNRNKEKQYLDVLESWYRAGYPIREYDTQGARIFKLKQGKNYAEIQNIKKEYGLEW